MWKLLGYGKKREDRTKESARKRKIALLMYPVLRAITHLFDCYLNKASLSAVANKTEFRKWMQTLQYSSILLFETNLIGMWTILISNCLQITINNNFTPGDSSQHEWHLVGKWGNISGAFAQPFPWRNAHIDSGKSSCQSQTPLIGILR